MSDNPATAEPTTDPTPVPDPKAEPTPEPKGASPEPDPSEDPKASEPTPSEDPKADPKAEPPASADWRETLPDDLKKHASRFNSIEDLVKANVDSRQKLSKAIIPPGKDAGDEEVAAYRKAIGVPEAPDGYKFELPEGAEASENDKAFHSKMAEAFHGLNVTEEQAKGLNKVWNELSEAAKQAQVEADKEFAEQADAALRKAWGGDYDANKAHADRAAEQMFGSDLDEVRHLETKDGRFVMDHPVMLKAMAQIGREMTEAGLVPALPADAMEQAESELGEIRAKIEKAQAKGDNATANRLYQKEQDLIAKMGGSKPIVGAAGRAA